MDTPRGTILDRYQGRAPNGKVFLRNFDAGVIMTMGAVREDTARTAGFGANRFIRSIPNVSPPPDHPGIPVIWSHPEDVFTETRLPAVVVTRNTQQPAMVRWHPGQHQYRAPAEGTAFLTFDPLERTGPCEVEEVTQAVPVDIEYTIRVLARKRGGHELTSQMAQANAIFQYLAEIFQPYSALFVLDSVGDRRSYSIDVQWGVEDDILDIAQRIVGFTLDLTVKGELDLNHPTRTPTVRAFPTITMVVKEDE